MNQRELGRKERAAEEVNRMCRRYDYECGDVTVHKLTPEQIQQLRDGVITLEDLKLEGERRSEST